MKVACKHHFSQIFCIITIVFSFALFLKCYFPFKKGLEGFSSAEKVSPEPFSGSSGLPNASFQRLVLIVIDALRTDFVLGDRVLMPFTRKLLSDGNGVAFSAKTHLPTVTLPRIKAITSGSIPGFVDVVMNFGSAAFTDDNLMTQLKYAGKMLTFFGDDTWLSLFPDHFARADGTTSFFVTDYTEVDNNVTRHLNEELSLDDWEVMTLHYLGLDHIGHLYGPTSDLVVPKLLEMDSVVRDIFTTVNSQSADRPTLLVVCGDHGMSDQGGHGGASHGETSVPIVFLSPHQKFTPQTGKPPAVQQIDLCPTLCAFLGLPVPQNNLGTVILGALPATTALRDRARLLQLNAAQIVNVMKENVGNIEADPVYQQYRHTVETHAKWLAAHASSTVAVWEAEGSRVLMGYQDAIQRMSERVGQTSTSYDMYGMMLCIVLIWLNLIIQLCLRLSLHSSFQVDLNIFILPFIVITMFGHVTACTSQHQSNILCGTAVVSLLVQAGALVLWLTSCLMLAGLLLQTYRDCFRKVGESSIRWPGNILTAFYVLHALSLLSSSFVEEEHQTWYFFATSFHTAILFAACLRSLGSTVCSVTCADNFESPSSFKFGGSDKEVNQSSTGENSDGASKTASPASSSKSQRSKRKREAEKENSREQTRKQSNVDDVLSSSRRLIDQDRKKITAGLDLKQHHSVDESTEERGHNLRNLKTAARGSDCFLATGSVAVMLVVMRILRRWNQTGNKWLDVPDVGDWLVRQENKDSLSMLVFMSLLGVFLIRWFSVRGLFCRIVLLGALASVYLFRAASGSLYLPDNVLQLVSHQGVVEARMTYLCTALILIHTFWKNRSLQNGEKESCDFDTAYTGDCQPDIFPAHNKAAFPSQDYQAGIHSSDYCSSSKCKDGVIASLLTDPYVWTNIETAWLCVMCLLLRPHNVIVVCMLSMLEALSGKCVVPWLKSTPSAILLYCLMMGQTCFFFQGNSNSLSTVDVSAAMTALYDYQPVVCGLQLSLSTYASIIFWLLAACKYTFQASQRHSISFSSALRDISSTALFSRALPLSVYTVLVTLMRHHLFVWTVFSPKLLYEGCLTIVMSLFCAFCLLVASSVEEKNKLHV